LQRAAALSLTMAPPRLRHADYENNGAPGHTQQRGARGQRCRWKGWSTPGSRRVHMCQPAQFGRTAPCRRPNSAAHHLLPQSAQAAPRSAPAALLARGRPAGAPQPAVHPAPAMARGSRAVFTLWLCMSSGRSVALSRPCQPAASPGLRRGEGAGRGGEGSGGRECLPAARAGARHQAPTPSPAPGPS
jgi:hypothetical protein